MRDEKSQLIDEAEMRSSTRKVLIVDEDIQDLSSHAMPLEAQGRMAYDYLEKPVSTEKMNWVHSTLCRNLAEDMRSHIRCPLRSVASRCAELQGFASGCEP